MTPRRARREVEFVEWDGSAENARQILSWLSENDQEAFYVHETDINPEHIKVPNKWGNENAYKGDIIVRYPNGDFGTFRAKLFHLQYKEVPSAPVEDVASSPADDGEVEPLLGLFDFYTISDGMHREIVKMFSDLAYRMSREIPKGANRSRILVELASVMDEMAVDYVLR